MKSNALRIVIDTNVFISAVLFEGEPSKLLKLWKKPVFKFLISKEILEEYIKVLSYPKFKLSEQEIKCIIEEELLPFIEPVNVISKLDVVREDLDDNKFIEAAIDGRADFIVSGDAHLLDLKRFQEIRVISAKEFIVDILK